MQRVHSRRNVYLVLLLFFSELRLAQTVQPSKIAIAKTFMERSACLKRAFVHERFLQCYFSLWAASHGIPPEKLPDEPQFSQETGRGGLVGCRNRDREEEKALIISP